MKSGKFVHPTAVVDPTATVGEGTKIWMNAQVREGVTIGEGCILGKDVYVDFGVRIGNHCKIENGAYLFHSVVLEDGVFVGPRACFTNDRRPRAVGPDGRPLGAGEWASGHTVVKQGASIGAGVVLLTDLTIGRYAMVGAGAMVLRDVGDFELVVGNPGRRIGYVCKCGSRLEADEQGSLWRCPKDGFEHRPNSP
jgi:UDP-2-acetamido-3-amino-2,3-dideoxy-glucuronate N-acetyltransferase